MPLATSLCFHFLTTPFLGDLQFVNNLLFLFFLRFLICFVFSVLLDSEFFFCVFHFSGSYYFFWEMQLILNQLTSFSSDVQHHFSILFDFINAEF